MPAEVSVIGFLNFLDLSINPIFLANFINKLKKTKFKIISAIKKV